MTTRILLFAITALPLACASPSDADHPSTDEDSGGESSSSSGPIAQLGFYEDVAPILAQHCNGCHRDGGVAPFALTSYAEASAWSESILAAIEARTMPPFNVNNDGSCHTFTDARWLADEEIDTIARWVAAELPEGDPELGVPEPPQNPTLTGPGVRSVSTPEAYVPQPGVVPGTEADDYRCFLVDPELAADRFLVGFEIVPGDDRIVHHVVVFNVDPERPNAGVTNGEVMAALDDQTPEAGWPCFGAAGDGVWVEGVPITWAPGTGATAFPEGVGVQLAAGQKLVVQVHYNLVHGEPGPAPATELKLDLADAVERRAHVALVDGFLLTLLSEPAMLPAGEPAAAFEYEVALSAIPNMTTEFDDVEVIGLLPHMHTRGERMQIGFDIDGRQECGAEVDRWDFDWQQTYFYDEPIPMKMSDRMRVRCEWNTMGESEPVPPGLGTDGEMCLVGVMVAER